MVCVDSQFYFSINLEEPSVYTKPEHEHQKVTVLVPEPLQPEPAVELEPVLPEPKLAPQKRSTKSGPKVQNLRPEPVAQKVEPPKKTPEAPEMIGKVVNHFCSFDQHIVLL